MDDIRVMLWIVTLISAIFSRVTIESRSRTKTSSSSNLAPGDIMQYPILSSTPKFPTIDDDVHRYVVDIVSSGSRIHLKCSPTGAETPKSSPRNASRHDIIRISVQQDGVVVDEYPDGTQVMLHDGLTLYEEDIVVVLPRSTP